MFISIFVYIASPKDKVLNSFENCSLFSKKEFFDYEIFRILLHIQNGGALVNSFERFKCH